MVEYLIGIHGFKGRSPDELDISKGDYVEVIEDDAEFGDSWYIGRNLTTNKTGLFPKVFTSEVSSNEIHSNDITATLSDIDQALYDIAAHSTPNPESVMYWTPYDVRTFFLSKQYSEAVAERFVQHQITGAILLEMDSNMLKELDIPSFGTRFEISKEIDGLRQYGTTPQQEATSNGVGGHMPIPQRPETNEASDNFDSSPNLPGTTGNGTSSGGAGSFGGYASGGGYFSGGSSSAQFGRMDSIATSRHTTMSSSGNHNSMSNNGNAQLLGSPMPSWQDRRHSRSASDVNGESMSPKKHSVGEAQATSGGHHRRHSSVSSILSGTGTPQQVSSPSASNGRLGRVDSKDNRFKGLKNASSQYLKPSLVKQKTSAFLEGIKETTAEESAKLADHSGWMQKRGGMGVGSWKGRFFTLHGTRLSYFSNFKDTKERGLIDITGHKAVQFGPDDKLVSLHAASFGAGKYGFKLIPPGPGFKKGVSFTAPRVHHFAVESEQEMHQWLQALMKATIERDDSVAPVSSCTTPVVSLPKAQEMIAEKLAHYYDSDIDEGDELTPPTQENIFNFP